MIRIQQFQKILGLWLLLLSLLLVQKSQAQYNNQQAPLSGCGQCGATGDCSQAFHHGPGQFCGYWQSSANHAQKPCCCPLEASCKLSQNNCLCHMSGPMPSTSNSNNNNYNSHHHSSHSSPMEMPNLSTTAGLAEVVSSAMAVLALALCLTCCCKCCCCGGGHDTKAIRTNYPSANRRQHDTTSSSYPDEHMPIAYATEILDPMAPPPATNPNYTPPPTATVQNYGATAPSPTAPQRGGGGGGGGWLSGLGGFALGTATGMAATHQWDRRHHTNNNNNNNGGGGGYDFEGDNDNGGGGFDFAGDTGGDGGFDFAGDTGGDFDFSGDS